MSNPYMYVVGIKLPNDRWRQMKAVYEACEKAGIAAPEEVDRFFNHEPPDDKGVLVGLDKCSVEKAKGHHPCVSEWRDKHSEGIEVDLAKLPEGVQIIRVFLTY